MFDHTVSILIPTFNRRNFSPLVVHNINCQTYEGIKEIIVADDGEEPLDMSGCKYPVRYFKMNRCNLGSKRNFLKNCVKSGYCCFMDTDDFYNPDHIKNALWNMASTGKRLAGSSDMLIYSQLKGCFIQRCLFLDMLNEATLVFHHTYPGVFDCKMSSEGVSFIAPYLGDVAELKIEDVMVCVAHDKNSVPKNRWLDDNYKTSFSILDPYRQHLEILSKCNI